MATRGKMIGRGKVPNFGLVKVFQDLDNTKMVFVQHEYKDEEKYLNRNRVYFIRTRRADVGQDLEAEQQSDLDRAVEAGYQRGLQVGGGSKLVEDETALDIPAYHAYSPSFARSLRG